MVVDWWARGVAVYGAVVATAGAIIQIIQHRRDRGKLKVWAMFALNHNDYLLPAPEGLLVTATNVGRQTITANGIASREGRNNFYWGGARNLPKRLEPTEQIGEWTENLAFITQRTTALYVFDTSGKNWYLPKQRLRELKQSVAKRSTD
jgi:hypothetical protein